MKTQKIAIYDFDGTLYKGDCMIDFYKFCLRKYPYKIVWLPYHLFLSCLWVLNLISDKSFKERFLAVVEWGNEEDDAKEFWLKNEKKMFKKVKQELRDDKKKGLKIIIISASPEFLLKSIANKLGANILIATIFEKGKIIGENCKGATKVHKLNELEKINGIRFDILKMVSDSSTDIPLYKLSKECYRIDKYGNILKGIPQ